MSSTFFFKLEGLFLPLLFLVFMITTGGFAISDKSTSEFIYNGFKDYNLLYRDGVAEITTDGLLRLTNVANLQTIGRAIYSDPIKFKGPPSINGNSTSNSSTAGNTTSNSTTADNRKVFTFSTTFVFMMIPSTLSDSRGQGLAFFVAPQRGIPGGQPSQYLGLFNLTNIGNPANHILAVELDTNMNLEYSDIDGNHVGIDINSIVSNTSKSAGYFTKSLGGDFQKLDLVNQKLQVWVEYDGEKMELDVTLAPFMAPKPHTPLLSFPVDLSPILLDNMYVGFSSSLGNYRVSSYIYGWSFKINGSSQDLDLPQLRPSTGPKVKRSVLLTISIILCVNILLFTF